MSQHFCTYCYFIPLLSTGGELSRTNHFQVPLPKTKKFIDYLNLSTSLDHQNGYPQSRRPYQKSSHECLGDILLRLLVYYLYIKHVSAYCIIIFFSMAIKKLVNGAKYLKSVHVYCLLSVSVVANTSGFINKGSFNVFVFLVCLYVLSQSTIIFYFLFSQ